MSRAPSARLRGAATVVVLLAGMGSLRSQDRSAAPSGPPPARNTATDTMEAARDEIRGLKVGREARTMPEGSLPRVAAPEWHGGTAAAPPAVRPVRPISPADTRNPNWLVEALQPTDAAGVLKRDREDAREGGPGARIGSDRADAARSRPGQTPVDSRGASERSPGGIGPSGTITITNPLTAYLDDWMTPQDLALLKPGLGGRSAGVLPLPDITLPMGGLPAGPQSTGGTFRGPDPVLLAPAGDRPGGTVRENPFLAALNAPVAGSAVAAETSRLAVPAPGPAAGPAPSLAAPPSPPSPPRIPDFARPAADEKYFKPLKRF